MKIIIDADGCPVIDITIRIAKLLDIEVIIISDTSHNFNKEGVEIITVSKGNDSADFAIVNKVEKNDIVITQDYGLAAMVLAKGACPINQNGIIYNNENIDQLLFTRHLSKKIRTSGGRVKGPKKRKKEDDLNFEKSLLDVYKSISG
ncbi:MAG: YaiI/YqxD family protein [Romboutsia sp.]|uniref:YaiI/YqxD family protein n=1 Tax=Romboutsia sp. TaxID=1965302 RepID=UPI003F308F9F